jgi:hypothetical protein
MDKTPSNTVTTEGQGKFRLDKYQITVAADGQISWQADGVMNKVAGGQCFIKSGVLFISSQEYAEGNRSKREFIAKLKELPQWDRTKVWSHSLALRPCGPQHQGYRPKSKLANHDMSKDRTDPEERTAVSKRESVRSLGGLSPSVFGFRKPSLHLRHEWSWAYGFGKQSRRLVHATKISLIWIISLVLTGLLLGFTLSSRGLEKMLHWFRLLGERYHEHKACRR